MSSPRLPWLRFTTGLASYRMGEYTDALNRTSAVKHFNDPADTPPQAVFYALTLHQLGNTIGAAPMLTMSESFYRRLCHDWLTSPSLQSSPHRAHQWAWWELASYQCARREALEQIQGEMQPGDPWQLLIAARGYYKIGELEKGEAALAEAVQAAPQDWLVVATRAQMLSTWGEHQRAEAGWGQAVSLAEREPAAWILRGKYWLNRGEPEKAAADFARAATVMRDGDGNGTLVVEAEQLLPVAKINRGNLLAQSMSWIQNFQWSGDTQLWWTQVGPGARLTVTLPVPQAGRYKISGHFTQAPDFGQWQLYANETKVGDPWGGYAASVQRTPEIVLGEADLRAGVNEFLWEVVGKQDQAMGYLVGIDDLRLTPVVGPGNTDSPKKGS